MPYRSVFRFSPIAAGVSTIRCAIKIAPRLQFASMVPLRTLSVKRPMRLVEANRVNRGFSSVQVYFAEKPELMAEVIKSR